MTDQKPKRNYDGNSEACVGCKAFYRTGDISAPCDTCSYRINEEKKIMTDQKPNCGNCPHSTHVISMDNEGCTKYNRIISWQQKCIINEVGCLSHPGARAWLMRDVIEELEGYKDVTNGDETPYDAYTTAIALIKGDVQK